MSVRLMTPGPTAILDQAQTAMAQPILHHRTEPFRAIVRECRDGLKALYRTQDEVLILAASGTGGMEAAVVSLLSPGDRVLVGSCGKFGDRWGEIAKAYGIEVDLYRTETGLRLDEGEIARRLERVRPRALFVTANETSVGVKNDLESLVRTVRRVLPDTLVVVDAITAVGAFRFETGGWDLDAVICGSQKALSLPPGLAFVSLSARAREAVRTAKLPRYYLDLGRELGKQATGDTGFTPAISLIVGLRASLAHYLGIGLETLWAETARRAAATRAGLGELQIELVPKNNVSEAVTAAWVPQGIDGGKLLKDLEALTGIKIAGGQGEFKGKIFRISHFGPVTVEGTIEVLTGIEELLARAGRKVERGAAVAAAKRVAGMGA